MAGACIKYSVLIFNLVFLVFGAAILAVAIWLRENKDSHEILGIGDLNINPSISMNILIAVGAIIMMLSILGCCSTTQKNRFMMILFFIGLLLMLLLQMVAGFLGVTHKSKIEHAMNESLPGNLNLLTSTDERGKTFQKALFKKQDKLKCCGLVNGASDWGNNFKYFSTSCECPSASDSSCTSYNGKTIYKQPCFSLISNLVSKGFSIVIGLAFGVAAVEVQYHLESLTLRLFPCLLIFLINIYDEPNINQMLQKSTGYQVPKA
ncbi:tetraspanin-8 isoform X1 [Sus scrofa]|uniref:Tetraspanin n=1 Tax=Sus scrofa TaxID=9823 RepID=A0A4X1W173_PIG|nr:tetraspanin-8 isoform X1 [Sus scrofa]XP_020947651.1 tetraspanin-8 isoform X1 [Sus scrofa]XP_020947652.1 tetraspanin-8 isoform X1 [Sus scrofa]XP_020947653.1 tetraspanin-8 isoform X1 [Sus scrofa]XP_020947654.1 tetraspanin-8 isoform X1 [Sus scrofa]XP_020947655.1 tetraspanin-8 isoform X1 [Sus scrofa]